MLLIFEAILVTILINPNASVSVTQEYLEDDALCMWEEKKKNEQPNTIAHCLFPKKQTQDSTS